MQDTDVLCEHTDRRMRTRAGTHSAGDRGAQPRVSRLAARRSADRRAPTDLAGLIALVHALQELDHRPDVLGRGPLGGTGVAVGDRVEDLPIVLIADLDRIARGRLRRTAVIA